MTQSFTPHGKHLIGGEWIASPATFSSQPAEGPSHAFGDAGSELVDQACRSAEETFWSYSATSRAERAAFLNAIADEIEALGEQITEIGVQETGLPTARLQGERGRTTGQIRLFASPILEDDYLDRRHDTALPDRQPLPRPDLKMVQRPLGPVAVFGASNFPLAFSTAGGDTASALAAGCPVVVKGHPAHPGTGEIVAEAIAAAVKNSGLPGGVFSFLQGASHELGSTLVQHQLIKAVGFTGSLGGGRALYDLCAARPEPIPFFGELGSVNPMFLLPGAVKARGAAIAEGWAGSLTMGAGQFCTNPGVAVAVDGPESNALLEATRNALAAMGSQTMLTEAIAKAYADRRDRLAAIAGVQEQVSSACPPRGATPALYVTSGEAWLNNDALGEEVFGPAALFVRVTNLEEMAKVAQSLHGQLTCTLHMDSGDTEAAKRLVPILERKAGRLLANGFPTGVEVSSAMVHGGPYPASTNFGATSVGTLAIRRFLRPVCYQNMPDDLLPAELG
ncbi:MAG: aldehyde dehydrogenase (NADP(+)) [Rhodobacteraceae bacterium]|nr:aldehyde dehydrogenase (NADP(+)) [Paracoccaceae bacterium]